MSVSIPVSIGELYDKISILEIKKEYTDSLSKLENINKELKLLNEIANSLDIPEHFKQQLYYINKKLWHIEDDIRKHEKERDFNEQFILLARMVYMYNDTRAEIKRNINIACGSGIIEEKIY
jgi:ATP-dependent Lon protease